MKRKTLCLLLTLALVLALLPGMPAAHAASFAPMFIDVEDAVYYALPVYWALENGITTGTGVHLFSPDKPCTRAQVVTFLWRSREEPVPAKADGFFSDVAPDAYYAKAVAWAVEQGVTKGVDAARFGPDSGCTRGQVVTFLWRAAGEPEPTLAATRFADVQPGAYYAKAVAWAVENGVTAGVSRTSFAPERICTRGQIITFLYRFHLKRDHASAKSEHALRDAVAVYGRIGLWHCADYDGDGLYEAFAITQMTRGSLDNGIECVYYVDAFGTVLRMVSDLHMAFYNTNADCCRSYGGREFFWTDFGGYGSGHSTLLFSVRDGTPYELALSRHLQGFYERDGMFYTTENEFLPEGGHLYPQYELIYDAATQQFSKGRRLTDG